MAKPSTPSIDSALDDTALDLDARDSATPLISLILLTFNSERTLGDTLHSIAEQACRTLEVLICDDGSSDGTVALARRWIEGNEARFARAVLLPSERNEGICRNVLKGYGAARGSWLKPLGGDDMLSPGAIAEFSRAAAACEDDVLIALLEVFSVDQEGKEEVHSTLPSAPDRELLAGPASKLREQLALRNPIPAPGVLIRRSAYEAVGGVDTDFHHLDDWPLWLRFVASGRSFRMLDKVLVRYRQSASSISKASSALAVNQRFLGDLVLFFEKYQRHELSPLPRWDRRIDTLRWKLAMHALRNHPRLYRTTRLLHALSPLAWRGLGKRGRRHG